MQFPRSSRQVQSPCSRQSTRTLADTAPPRKATGERERTGVTARALLVCPSLTRQSDVALRSLEARREEAVGLARAIDLAVVGAESVALSAIRPATFIGNGKGANVA